MCGNCLPITRMSYVQKNFESKSEWKSKFKSESKRKRKLQWRNQEYHFDFNCYWQAEIWSIAGGYRDFRNLQNTPVQDKIWWHKIKRFNQECLRQNKKHSTIAQKMKFSMKDIHGKQWIRLHLLRNSWGKSSI